MFRKFLDGLAFGAGFGLTFVAVWFSAYYLLFPGIVEHRLDSIAISQPDEVPHDGKSSEVVTAPPPIMATQRFLGSPGIYSGDFLNRESGVLATGPGTIIGQVTADGKAAQGLKLRLALNGKVLSQWARSDANGQYAVPVPYGEYRIDGYELNRASADRALPGMIGHPQMAHSSQEFTVSSESPGYGLAFKFVSPVVKVMTKKRFSASEDVVIEWLAYPGATQYRIQLLEKKEPHGFARTKRLFEWQHRPVISETRVNLSDFFDTELKAGHFYSVEVSAFDDNTNLLSETAHDYRGYDFEIVN